MNQSLSPYGEMLSNKEELANWLEDQLSIIFYARPTPNVTAAKVQKKALLTQDNGGIRNLTITINISNNPTVVKEQPPKPTDRVVSLFRQIEFGVDQSDPEQTEDQNPEDDEEEDETEADAIEKFLEAENDFDPAEAEADPLNVPVFGTE